MTLIQTSDDAIPRLHELGRFETGLSFSRCVTHLGRPWKFVLGLRFPSLQGSYHKKFQLAYHSCPNLVQSNLELPQPSLKELLPPVI